MPRSTRRTRLASLGVATALLLLCGREWLLLPDGHAHLSVLDVGQGDSILIVSPSGKRILVDGGPDLRTLEKLGGSLPFFDRRIDLLVLTHPHLDHLASFPEIVDRYDVRAAVLNATPYASPRYAHFLDQLAQRRIPVIHPDDHGVIDCGDGLVLERLWPSADLFGLPAKNVHAFTVVLRASYRDHSILLTGDLEDDGETEILRRGIDVRAEILKVGHHGSLTSTSTGFLLAVRPRAAVISVGAGNSFGHPRPEILSRLARFGVAVHRTDRDGTASIVW